MSQPIGIITGAAGNLGRAVTQQLLDQGYQVYATLGPHDDPGFITSPHLSSQAVDLTNEQATAEYVERLIAEQGTIDLVVMIVGGFAPGNLFETTTGDLEKMFRLNFLTAWHVIKPLLEHFKAQNRGQFVLIGSKPGLDARFGTEVAAYGISKSMLVYLSDLINATFEDTAVTSTVIAPSTIDTPGTRKAMPDADFSKWVTPQDIADAIAFLTSNAGRQLRQTVFKVYGNS